MRKKKDSDILTYSPIKLFTDTCYRVNTSLSALSMWGRLSNQDRKFFKDDLNSSYYKHGGSIGMMMVLRGISFSRAVIELGLLIGYLTKHDHDWLLRENDESILGEEAVAQAINSCPIVMRESPNELHWQGELVEVDWKRNDSLWRFLWEVALHAKRGSGVDSVTFNKDGCKDYIAKCKNKLKSKLKLPTSLIDSIIPTGRGTQKLDLPPDNIRLFEVEYREIMIEKNP
jgi:hypothetical protein